MSNVSKILETLTPEKRALLLQQLQKQKKVPTQLAIQPYKRETNEVLPSFAQQRFWFLHQLEPQSSLYNVPTPLRITSPLHIKALVHSFTTIVQRHEVLRTTFHERHDDKQLVQCIAPFTPSTEVEIPVIDLRYLAPDDREKQIRQLAQQEAEQPFNLAHGPLLRVSVIRAAEQEHVLLLTMHHIVCDEWSMNILLGELAGLYYAKITDLAAPLPALPIQYADYAYWQRNWLQGEVLQKQLGYWKTQLAAAPEALHLPIDHPYPAVRKFVGKLQTRVIPLVTMQKLKALSQHEGTTLFMTLLAAFQLLLMRHSGQEDIVVGSPIANRNRRELEDLIGIFVNTLVLRTDLSGDPSFRQLLARVQDTTLQAYAHQDLPFERLVEELQPERSARHSPLFQVMFVMLNAPQTKMHVEELSWQPIPFEQTRARLDLTMQIAETTQGLSTTIEYDTALFEEATIARLLQHWQVLLEAISQQPDQHISHLSLLPDSERQLLLATWNATTTSYPKHATIPALFEDQARTIPDAIALVEGEQMFTYQELEQRANQLAHYLDEMGVGPETLVGVCLDRSSLLVIALLAILKAGGAYVPLDPSYPKERLAYMLADSGIAILLTQQRHTMNMPDAQTGIIYLDHTALENFPITALHRPIQPMHLAYVTYTSGSTGEPKGIAIPQRAVVRLLFATNYIVLDSQAWVAQVSNVSFDAATFEIWGALLHGGRLIIVPRESVLDPQVFTTHLQEQAIHTLFLTTALLNQLAREVPNALASVNQVLFGGEAVDPRWVKVVLQQGAPQRLLHVYGPSESTTFASWYHVQNVAPEGETIPIGAPLANTQCYVLDEQLQPVPLGVRGELYIGGDGLAQGYLNQPGLTAERFVPHPFSSLPGARLYQTGDLVRSTAEGMLEYVGRLDHQVKIRGYRIEPDEIAAVLQQHPAVQACVVIVHKKQESEEKRLIAYVVPIPDQQALVSELRQALQAQLPAYMLPSAFILLERFPLNANGKLDRNALPDPESIQHAPIKSGTPRNPLEEHLAAIWSDMLDLPQISIYDNFFELGGHSLLAVQMINQINTAYGTQLSATVLFQKQTIEQLGELLYQPRHTQTPSPLIVPLRAGGSKQPFYCIHPASGDLYNYLGLLRYLDPEQPLYGIQAQGVANEQEPLTSIEEMATTYLHALLAMQREGPYLLGGHSIGGLIAFEMARQLEAQGKNVTRLIVLDGVLASQEEAEQTRRISPDQIHVLEGLIEILKYYSHSMQVVSYEELAQLALEEQQLYLLNCLKVAQVLPQEMQLAQFQRQLRIFQANAYSRQTYRPESIYHGKVTLLYCEQGNYDPIAMWIPFVRGELKIHAMPGNHYSMLNEPFVSIVAAHTQHYLNQTEA